MAKHVTHLFNKNERFLKLEWSTLCGGIPENKAHVTRTPSAVTCKRCLKAIAKPTDLSGRSHEQ